MKGVKDDKELSYLLAKVDDSIKSSKSKMNFIGFLDEGEQLKILNYLKNKPYVNYILYGGHDESERKIFATIPDYFDKTDDLETIKLNFPISPLTLTFKKEYKLSHRDFLGSLMSKGIEREVIGDILVEDGRCVIFIKEDMVGYIKGELAKIGSVGVKVSEDITYPLPTGRGFTEIVSTVSSGRLDCVISSLINVSRSTSSQIIRLGDVEVNYDQIDNISFEVNENDIISIRHKGKFSIQKLGPLTKKGRLAFVAKKYK